MSTGNSTFDPQQALSQHVLKNFYVGGEWTKPQRVVDRVMSYLEKGRKE